jgi:NhaP-type Na+/H+ or K+/H+ antiporter
VRWRPGSPTRVLALAVWFVFGAGLVPVAFGEFSLALLGYALLSVTLFRIVPVAVSMVRSSLSRRVVLFVGWFGPRSGVGRLRAPGVGQAFRERCQRLALPCGQHAIAARQ